MAEKELTRRQFLKGISVTCASGSLLISPLTSGATLGKDKQRESVVRVRQSAHQSPYIRGYSGERQTERKRQDIAEYGIPDPWKNRVKGVGP
jgi:hypothetical protein